MNIEQTVICKYAGNKEQCKQCSHAVSHLKGAACMVPQETCVDVNKQIHLTTTVVCEKYGSKKECEKCEHAIPHLQNCACNVMNICNTTCQSFNMPERG